MCRHCNNDFGKHDLSKKMDIKRAVELLHEMKALGMNSIQFTGGEITMYPEFMPPVVVEARKLAIRINKPPTNCYIAHDRRAAEKFFSDLKEAGYTSGFRLSVDPYHNGKIPLSYVAAFIKYYAEHFSVSGLTIGSSYYDREEIFRIYDRLLGEMAKAGISDCRLVREKKGIFIGGKKIKYGIWKPTRPSWQELDDREVELKIIKDTPACLGPHGVGYLWVEPDFRAKVCSCNGNGFLDYYYIGNLSSESVKDVVKRASENPVFRILAEGGPARLREAVNAKKRVLDPEKKYTFMCELCNEIVASRQMLEEIGKTSNSRINI